MASQWFRDSVPTPSRAHAQTANNINKINKINKIKLLVIVVIQSFVKAFADKSYL